MTKAPTRLCSAAARQGALAVLVIAWAAVSARAQTQPSPPAVGHADDDWRVRLAVPIWLAGTSGSLTVLGHELEPSEDPSTIDLWDSHISFAAALHAEVEK